MRNMSQHSILVQYNAAALHDSTPVAEYHIDEALVRGLLADQHPDLARLSLWRVDAGWDNAMFRLGDDLCVRLPRRQVAAQLLLHEQTWLPVLAARLPLAIPVPVRLGSPGRGYPWHWSVVPWLHGETADLQTLHPAEARTFAAFLAALHTLAPPDAPVNPVRGVPLQQRATAVTERMQRLRAQTTAITQAIVTTWADALAAPVATDARWIHGDLHARNVLVHHGRLRGIIDWGDLAAGDVATDLASLWMLFATASARQEALACYRRLQPVADATIRRARGWAALFGVVLLATGRIDQPRHAAMGAATLQRLTADAATAF